MVSAKQMDSECELSFHVKKHELFLTCGMQSKARVGGDRDFPKSQIIEHAMIYISSQCHITFLPLIPSHLVIPNQQQTRSIQWDVIELAKNVLVLN